MFRAGDPVYLADGRAAVFIGYRGGKALIRALDTNDVVVVDEDSLQARETGGGYRDLLAEPVYDADAGSLA